MKTSSHSLHNGGHYIILMVATPSMQGETFLGQPGGGGGGIIGNLDKS